MYHFNDQWQSYYVLVKREMRKEFLRGNMKDTDRLEDSDERITLKFILC